QSADIVNGCQHSRTITYTATACGLTSTCERIYTWTESAAPVFDNCTGGSVDLGCNPATIPACDPLVAAHNECGTVPVSCDIADSSAGCSHTRTITYTAVACGLTSTCERT